MTNHRPPGDAEPGENRRCITLHDHDAMTNNRKEVTPLQAVPTVDTAGLRAQYRALPGPDAGRAGPGAAVLALARQGPGPCDEVDGLAALRGQARRAYADLAAAGRAALAGLAEGEPDPWWYLRDEFGTGTAGPPEPGLPCGGWCR